MAFYKKVKKAINGKWYPQAVTVGKPVTTKDIAQRLSRLSTVSRADVYAVLGNLGQVMADVMAEGKTVKLDGVGTFFYTAVTNGQGVDSREEVSVKQIRGVHIRFIPEAVRASNRRIISRPMEARDIEWIDIEGDAQETADSV